METALKQGNYVGLTTEDLTETLEWIAEEMGKVKAEQIQKTGAKVVATNCYNCRTQISELNTKYKLGVKVKSIVELVADSLDVSEKEK